MVLNLNHEHDLHFAHFLLVHFMNAYEIDFDFVSHYYFAHKRQSNILPHVNCSFVLIDQ